MRRLFLTISLFLLAIISQAQRNLSVNPISWNDVTFSAVKNGFNYDLQLPEKADLSSFIGISANIANNGDDIFRLEACINESLWVGTCVYLEPGEMKTLKIVFQRIAEKIPAVFKEMRGIPGGTVKFSSIDPKHIDKISFKVFTKGTASFSISEIRPYGEYISPQKISEFPNFFPFIDFLGQYKFSDWPGKVKDTNELSLAITSEQEILKTLPKANGRDRFGGWADGPKLKATGNFRVEKVDGKWWMVDPEGSLFWSHGITGVRLENGATSISNRKKIFENLPDDSSPLSVFYSKRKSDTIFNYSGANLYRKYGDQWKEKAIDNISKRLKSWGINSFGNWSDPEIYLRMENRIPYTVALSPNWPKVDGKEFKFPNVFDPEFVVSIKNAMNHIDPRIFKDEYCIGFFIDNELNVEEITRGLIKQPEGSKSKLPFFDYIKNKYSSIQKLNLSWKSKYENWEQVELLSTLPEDAKEDIKIFDLKMLDIYYKTCREELKRVAPEKIYFGSRLHCHFFPDDQKESQVIKVASQYCDVVCFNRYRFTAEELILPFGIDKPVLIGEFHFGALDRGLCHSGLRGVADQNQRADAYYHYVEGALKNPQMVGTHWFQYSDQAYTGRFDGENLQIGFVDICDNPYPEIIEASRKIGYPMYKIRYNDLK
jgi:hypothetical protein